MTQDFGIFRKVWDIAPPIYSEDFYRAQIATQMQKHIDRLWLQGFDLGVGYPAINTQIKEKTMRKFVLKATKPGYGPYFRTDGVPLWAVSSPANATRFDSRDDAERAIEVYSREIGQPRLSVGLVTREVEVTPGARELRVVGEGEPRTGYVVNVYFADRYINTRDLMHSGPLSEATVFPHIGPAAHSLARYVNGWALGHYREEFPANILPVLESNSVETVTEVPGQ